MNNVKDKIAQQPLKRVRQVYERLAAGWNANASSDDDDYVPEFNEIKSSLNRKRREFYPAIPWRIRDVDINGPWCRTWNNKKFMCCQKNRWG